jgi:nucleoside-diphosphate-sugar epimerase
VGNSEIVLRELLSRGGQGAVYLAELEEVLELPADVWGRANPKSSTGRLDVFSRVISDAGGEFDRVPAGYTGALAFDTSRPNGPPRKLTDPSRLMALGWRPKIDLETGLADAYRWYVENVAAKTA